MEHNSKAHGVAWRGKSGRKMWIAAGYAAAMTVAKRDLAAMSERHMRNYGALCREAEQLREQVEELKREVEELRQMAQLINVRDPRAPVH